ncbi:uncharacterized protein TrAtP1_006965 [Trichoderma atroviride]|uniref:uncharacterized protein n=1 Tax=Hypocrea atroviridis TaxID=63577 RepID=UPI00331661F9|nr:hypothetical protein TrAtP1_006965 [Trichoderma atroviride]
MALPTTTRAWSIAEINKDSFDSLVLKDNVPLPKLGERDVLVQIEAVSLNYRDLAIPKGFYPFTLNLPVVPGSDSAGIILATGSKVTKFAKGDRVCTLFNEHHQTNPITPEAVTSGFGGAIDGTLREYAVFGDHALVKAPSTLNAIEASTLTCAPPDRMECPLRTAVKGHQGRRVGLDSGHRRCQSFRHPVCRSCWRDRCRHHVFKGKGRGVEEARSHTRYQLQRDSQLGRGCPITDARGHWIRPHSRDRRPRKPRTVAQGHQAGGCHHHHRIPRTI